ncbi:transient receptor potential cation channel subfamily V member 5-like [Lineus longissimus]|uniref:transient receptor potential cation channel subfamily V member 5-like n=1 Tax=Lineus longissimus TaxID=88925 RepID=UPI00315CC9DD
MSAPIQLQFTQLNMNAAFLEVKDFLAKEKYSRFVATLVRAIKSDSVHAVEVMVEILKMFGFDLYEPMFRESVYTASMLHVALLFKRDEICRLLIKEFPKLVTVKYESEKFQNQTAIHIAASNGQYEILSDMLAAVDEATGKELLNTIADGSYFTDVHQAGALALTAAAYSGLHEMLRMLIKRGADPDVKGLNGNTVLHCIVIFSALYPQSETPKILFDEVWETCTTWWQRHNIEGVFHSENQRKMAQVDAFRYLLSIRNDADQNVLSLAVHLHSNLTMHILNIEHIYKLPQTKFGAMSWSTYDVTEVASYAPPSIGRANRYNAGSILHILAHRAKLVTQDEDESYSDIVEEEPIRTLVKMKWQTYRFVYIAWFAFHLLAMTCLTGVALHFYQPDLNHNTFHDPLAIQQVNWTAFDPVIEDTDPNYRAVHPWYILFGVYPVVLIVLEFLDIFSTGYSNLKSLDTGAGKKSKKRKQYLVYLSDQYSATGNAPYRITGIMFSLSTLTWLCFHFAGDIDQDMPLSLSMIFGWIFMLYFTRGCRHICEFSIMMQKMFFQDCAYFIAVYSFFWLAFSTGMHVLLFYGNTPAPHFGNTLYHMLNIITDAGDKSSADGARRPAAAATLLSIYAVVSVVLLLNMLIAMMNTSYEAVKSSKTNVYRNQQLSIMLMLERRLWWWVWLCETSQQFTWSPKKPSYSQEKTGEGSGIKTNARVYLEITEKSPLGAN